MTHLAQTMPIVRPTATALFHHRERKARLARIEAAAENFKRGIVALPAQPSTAAGIAVYPAPLYENEMSVVADTAAFIEGPIRIEGNIRKIQNLVCENLRIQRSDLLSARRNRACVMARQIGMFLSFESTSASSPDIGRRFGGRDHTTVLHAVRRVSAMLNTKPGTGISTQWKASDCDTVRSHVAMLRVAFGARA